MKILGKSVALFELNFLCMYDFIADDDIKSSQYY
jgi:hypothetical protein